MLIITEIEIFVCIRAQLNNPVGSIRVVFSVELRDTHTHIHTHAHIQRGLTYNINQIFIFIHVFYKKVGEKRTNVESTRRRGRKAQVLSRENLERGCVAEFRRWDQAALLENQRSQRHKEWATCKIIRT